MNYDSQCAFRQKNNNNQSESLKLRSPLTASKGWECSIYLYGKGWESLQT